ncbi:prostate-associated microseminoprotein-like [Megalops cyprinoides]|uniref:prostate-associated microseminoprotein-like n=1 Tax=Megalops cyprinoides TaxID=118141 RepID=UPI001863A374|nr:prostate-associated microseminoprotein-like [Megalops cyprinoides]
MRRMRGESLVLVAAFYMLSAVLPCLSVYSSGECYFDGKASCAHQGQVFEVGESWLTRDCYQCICMEPFGVGCCELNSLPVDYPDWCEVVRKPDSCNVVVVMRANRKLPCLYGGRSRLRPGAGQTRKSDNDLF